MIPSVDYRSQYLTDGSGTVFAYGFPIKENGFAPAKTFLQVIKTDLATSVDTVLTVDTDYTVNGIGSDDSADWTITLPTAGLPLPTGSRITIIPNLPPVQMEDLSSQGSARPDRLEAMDDYQCLLVQQLTERLSRAVITPAGTGATDYDPNAFLTEVLASVAAASSSATAAGAQATAAANSATAAAASAATIQPFDINQYAFALGTNTITATLSPAPTAYATGMQVQLNIPNANTGAATLNLNGLGAKAIQKHGVALTGTELVANQVAMFTYDGTAFQLNNPTPPTGIIRTVKSQVFTGSGTYTPTTGMVYCIVEALGGGGGGSGVSSSASQTCLGGGGGSGAYSKGLYTAATIGASQTVTIGAAGAGGAIGTAGGSGGSTSFGTLIVCGGGAAGTNAGSTASVAAGVAGGGGGTITTAGNILGTGGNSGAPVFYVPGGGTGGISGSGGSSQYGAGGKPVGNATTAGAAASGFGAGGGGGAAASAGNTTGAAGTAGIILITEYLNA